MAHARSAAWEALGDYDHAHGVPLSAFVHLRVTSKVLTRYRQEWSYAAHCALEADEEEREKMMESPARPRTDRCGSTVCSTDYHYRGHFRKLCMMLLLYSLLVIAGSSSNCFG
jgi:hypothetical protein